MHTEPSDFNNLAKIPEHSALLMTAMNGAETLCSENYIFYKGPSWLLAIGYPLTGEFSGEQFVSAAETIASNAGVASIYAIAPFFPARFASQIIESDRYYVLSTKTRIPGNLRNPVKKAKAALSITETSNFTPAHRKLWKEFLEMRQSSMNERVKELFLQTPQALVNAKGALRLLNAYDAGNNLTACLLLDYSPANFTSYILGAHSQLHYVPHAMDALFAEMLDTSLNAGKRFIHLGLGVNSGILRFKRKWGGIASWPFNMAQWNLETAAEETDFAQTLCRTIIHTRPDKSARQLLANEPATRPFAMLWRIEKNGMTSWLGGTAHFFLYSFAPSLRKLFAKVDNVLFEGPLDAEFMARVAKTGQEKPADMPSLLSCLTAAEISNLEKTVSGRAGVWKSTLTKNAKMNLDIRHLLATAWPWHVFFTLWTTFLETMGWKQSVDMEAWRIAHAMNKNVIAMENIEEQLESLQSLPVERAINFFRQCHAWKKRARQNLHAYLAGDLEKMMGSSAEFPTRTEHIVGRRDERFRQRMKPWLEKGNAAVFVGSAHIVNLRHMLVEDGFSVTQAPFGIVPKLKLGWRSKTRPDEFVKW